MIRDRILRIAFALLLYSPLMAAGYYTWPDGAADVPLASLTLRTLGGMLASALCFVPAAAIVIAVWDD